ncbi:hypothetical protein [Haliscomenobacter hydrossis]|uniref:Effector-associated domain-containing protein n=1 Tax=Haliscomenobacter hydrossis (strain ATCC 27775 / DSM 1100 / LMG 10767 / O) TaxID=760192 RepID=F4KVQ2_HALH1|nr:hypothetical protein [Haliscomenobacter hydrossis]AEE52509.1 hypothetical protein Halhy_4674 [Haliscomenobacter hydrossis DSM 1100]
MRNKREIRALIADGNLSEAAQAALEYAEASADAETLNGLVALQADLSQLKEMWISGQMVYEELARTQARITQGLLLRVDELPDEPSPKAAKRRIKEESFKWLVFYLFLLAKLLVLSWALFNWQTEGFKNAEAFSLFNALLPGTIINASIMFRSLFRGSLDAYTQRRFVKKRFRGLIFLAFLGYIVVQFFLVVQKVQGHLSFELATLGFAAVETALGQFMSEIVEGIFKQESK